MRTFYRVIIQLNARERLIFLGALLICIASALFLGWRWYIAHTVIIPAHGGTYIEGMVGQPALLNPISAAGEIDQELLPLLFSDLIQLTEFYKVSPDNRVWSIVLKKDLLWDDGEKLTADDVMFTIATIQDPNTHSPLYNDWKDVTAERLNENEVRLTLKTPYVFFIDNLKQLRPAPKHIFGSIPITNFRLSNYNLEPIGSGPYRYLSFDKEKNGFIRRYQLAPNPKFHGTPPFIENFQITFFLTVDEVLQALNHNEISATGALDAKNIALIKAGYQIKQINIPRYYGIFFNLSEQTAPTRDPLVRQALALAINKKKIVSEVFGEGALIIDGPIFPGLEGFAQNFYAESYDPEQAKKLLEQAKLKTKPTLDLIVPQIPFLTETASLIKQDWNELGVKTNVIIMEPQEVAHQIIQTRNYTAILFGNILRANPDIFPFWHSTERFYPGLNLSLYNNKEVDQALEELRRESSSVARQRDLLVIQKRIQEDRPAIFLFSPDYFYVTTDRLYGFNTDFLATAADRFTEANQFYLRTRRQFK